MQEVTEYMKIEIINYLKSEPLIDTLVSENHIKFDIEPPVSEKGYHLDYQSLYLEKFSYEKEDKIYATAPFFWNMPYRVMGKHNKVVRSYSGKTITGVVSRIEFKLKFNEDTGEPQITILNNIKSSHRVNH